MVRYNPTDLDQPLGQYSHVTRCSAKELLFIAGQLHAGEDIKAQCDGVFGAIHKVLRSADANWDNVAQFTTYLTSEELIPEFMAWRLEHFPKLFGSNGYPPNTLLVVQRLVHPDFLIEVQTIASI